MSNKRITADDTAIVLVDYAVGFGNLFRSHSVAENVNAATALAKTARAFNVPLVVTHGADTDPPGPMYPSVADAIGDTPVVVREGQFNAFDSAAFETAVEATGRRRLLIAGLMTEGCVLGTTLGALERGYEVQVVLDASAGETAETHNVAVQRLVQAGVVPTTWLAAATELQVSWDHFETVGDYIGLMGAHSPQLGMNLLAHQAASAAGSPAAA